MGSTRGGASVVEGNTHPSEDVVSSEGVPMLKLVGSISGFRGQDTAKRRGRSCFFTTTNHYYPKVPRSPQERPMLLLRNAALLPVFNE